MASVKGYLIANSVVQLIGANHVKTKNSQLISPAGGLLNAAGKAWNFEDGTTTGWSTYADAAGVAPVDGTGGSPNVTFAASQTLPNFGEWCGLFQKMLQTVKGKVSRLISRFRNNLKVVFSPFQWQRLRVQISLA